MFVLDTNVVSELMKPSPDRDVLAWLDTRPTRDLFVTCVTEAEIRAGVAVLPDGVRRRRLAEAADRTFTDFFAGRLLPFDSFAARTYAAMFAVRQTGGRPLDLADGQIAAIARSRRMAVATRNTRDFENVGVELENPWEART